MNQNQPKAIHADDIRALYSTCIANFGNTDDFPIKFSFEDTDGVAYLTLYRQSMNDSITIHNGNSGDYCTMLCYFSKSNDGITTIGTSGYYNTKQFTKNNMIMLVNMMKAKSLCELDKDGVINTFYNSIIQ